MDEQTVALKDENLSEEEASETSAEQTEQTTGESQEEKTSQDTEKKEANPYKEQVNLLEEQLRQKNGALKEARQKGREVEEIKQEISELKNLILERKDEGDDKEKSFSAKQAERLIEEKISNFRLQDKLENLTSNPDEQKLIKHHLEHSIVRTGNVDTDLKMAVALANQHLVEQAKRAENERVETEAIMAKVSGGQTYGKETGGKSDPISRGAAQMLKNLGVEDGEKYI